MSVDPSSGIHPDLLPHVHLVANYRYPVFPRVEPGDVTKWLLEAAKHTLDQTTFNWTMLDRTPDGSILLTWQPLQRLGVHYASDGYVWAQPENLYKQDMGNGLILEVYYHTIGYAPGEPVATHCRRRFRLVPTQPNPNGPHADPSLWLIHYGPVDNTARVVSESIPIDDNVRKSMAARQYLQKCGPIQRKDFKLADRANWPKLPFPQDQTRSQPYGVGPRGSTGVPQQVAYPPKAPSVPPAKRARRAPSGTAQLPAISTSTPTSTTTGPNTNATPMSQQGPPTATTAPQTMAPGGETSLEEEEDTVRGDLFDHLTPRDIALSRYQLNHEWMEELVSSPYPVGRIEPPELGLARKGVLAPLTKGIFPDGTGKEKPVVGRIDKKMAEMFRSRVSTYIGETEKELESMRKEHEAKMANLKKESLLVQAEHALRVTAYDSKLHLQASARKPDDEGDAWSTKHPHKKPDEIVREVEESLGRKTATKPTVHIVQKGSVLTPEELAALRARNAPPPAVLPEVQTGPQGDLDIDMGGTASAIPGSVPNHQQPLQQPFDTQQLQQQQLQQQQLQQQQHQQQLQLQQQQQQQLQQQQVPIQQTNPLQSQPGGLMHEGMAMAPSGLGPSGLGAPSDRGSGSNSNHGASNLGTPMFDSVVGGEYGMMGEAGDALASFDEQNMNMDIESSAFANALPDDSLNP